MIILEVSKNKTFLFDELKAKLHEDEYSEAEINNSIGNELVQLILPIAVVLIPAIADIIKKAIENEKVTIKYGEIEVSAKGRKDAEEIFIEIIKLKNAENDRI